MPNPGAASESGGRSVCGVWQFVRFTVEVVLRYADMGGEEFVSVTPPKAILWNKSLLNLDLPRTAGCSERAFRLQRV